MRLTVEDVHEHALTGRVDVFVDGKRVTYCIEADEEAGYAVCWQTDEHGNLVLGQDRLPKTIRLEGRVEIKIRDAALVTS